MWSSIKIVFEDLQLYSVLIYFRLISELFCFYRVLHSSISTDEKMRPEPLLGCLGLVMTILFLMLNGQSKLCCLRTILFLMLNGQSKLFCLRTILYLMLNGQSKLCCLRTILFLMLNGQSKLFVLGPSYT